MPKEKTEFEKTCASMKKLGVYRKEYDPTIALYSQLMEQYRDLYKRFLDENMPFSVSTPNGVKKSPIVTTLESLRKDILAYSTQLGLNPHGLKRLTDDAMQRKQPASKLETALSQIT